VVVLCRQKSGEIAMGRTIAYVGVPTSLGSYGPGQEKAPQAFRDAGFPEMLRKDGAVVPSSFGSARDLIRDGHTSVHATIAGW